MKKSIISTFIISVFLSVNICLLAQNINKPNVNAVNNLSVNTFSGNLHYSLTDLQIPCKGISIDITFYYNSASVINDYGYGKGWSLTYSMYYDIDSNKVIIGWGDGRKDIYTYNGFGYAAPEGIFDSLTEYVPGKYKLGTKSGMNYFFDDSYSAGLTKISDPNSNELVLTYNGQNVSSITDPCGRSVYFNYTSGHLTDITDPNTTPARHFTFSNDTLGNPLSVTDPLGNITSYEYDPHCNIIKVSDQASNDYFISYYDFTYVNQIVSSLTSMNISYDTTLMKTTSSELVNSSSDQSTSFDYDSTGNLKEKMGSCCGYHETYDYDSENNITQKTDANGNLYQYSYDSRGNLLQETDPLSQTTVYTYEPVYNRITSIIDKRGNTTSYTYDANGNLLHENKPLGISEHYTYDAGGNVVTYTDGRGLVTLYEYNSNGDRTKVTYPDAEFETYAYDNAGNKTSYTDANGHTTVYQYDLLNRKISESNPLGNTTTYTYDSRSNMTSVVDPMGHVTSYTYDALSRMISTSTPAGTTTSSYDGAGNVLTKTDGNGNTTNYSYDSRDLMISETNPLGHVRTYSYDGNGNKISESDYSGHLTTYQHDALNRMIQVTDPLSNNTAYTYDANSNKISTTDANGHTTTYTYDALNRNTQIQMPIGLTTMTYDANDNIISTADQNGYVTTTAYDNRDRITSVTDALGHSILYTYDAGENKLTNTDRNGHTITYTYDALDRRITETNPEGDVNSTSYNPDNLVTSVTTPGGNVTAYNYDAAHRLISSSDNEGPIVSYTYDANSNRLAETNGNGNTTNHTYDGSNRLTIEIDPLGKTTFYAYNNNSRLTSVTDRNGNTISYSYDALERRISMVSTLGNMTTNSYDAVGNTISMTDAKGNTTTYAYDANDRLTTETFANGTSRNYTYDAEGNRTSRTDNNGNLTTYSYDAVNRLILTDYPGASDNSYTYDYETNMLSANNSNAAITFTYDAADRRLSENMNGKTTMYSYNIPARERTITYPGGRNIEEDYDFRLRISNINEGVGIAAYTYDAGNRMLTRTYGNGVVSTYSYNNNNWNTVLSHKKGSDTVAIFSYNFDHVGNILYEEKIDHSTNSEKYHYDAEYKLDSFKVGTLSGGNIPAPITQTRYDYDQAGNRTSIINNTDTTSYTSNSVNAYTNVTDSNIVNPTYDQNGNTITDGRFTYSYDSENRLLTVDGGSVATYQYDALYRRIQKVTASGTTKYFYDDKRIIEERDGLDAVQATYIYGVWIDDVLNTVRGGVSYFYCQNSLGSITAVTDNTGSVSERYEYNAYGKPAISDANYVPRDSSAIGNPYMFTGREFDAETENYHYRARFYKSDWGRFGQWDPLGFTNGMKLYEYVGNNPINLIDPYGLEFKATEVEKVRHIDNPPTRYGSATANPIINAKCECCADKTWKITLVQFLIAPTARARTHFYNKWEGGAGKQEFERTEANIQMTVDHEKKHLNNFKKWHDENEKEIVKELNTECKFKTEKECNKERATIRNKFVDKFNKFVREEVAHSSPEWKGYVNPPLETKP